MSAPAEQVYVATDPDIKTPTDYANPESPLEDVEAGPSQEDIDEVFLLADAARAAGAWSDEEA